MKALIVTALLLSAASADLHATEALFTQFKATHGKTYGSAAEEERRFAIFSANMRKAAALNKANPLAHFGPNEFADLTAAEFKSHLNGEMAFAAAAKREKRADAQPVEAACQKIDWREKGKVTAVKNQGNCGSCWAFSAVGNIEAQWAVAGNSLVRGSEQQLVSCDKVDHACNGGLMHQAFDYLINGRKGELVTEEAYPYTSGNGILTDCRSAELDRMEVAATISAYVDLAGSESQMSSFVCEKGTIAVAVDATSWQSYKSGILTDCIASGINHGVLAVGFDDTHSTPYWIIKNSWGTSWGEQGYIRISKNKNTCQITEYALSATVAKTSSISKLLRGN